MKECKQCGGQVPPRMHTGGPEKVFCSDGCGSTYRSKKWSKTNKGREYDKEKRNKPDFQPKRRARRDVRTAVTNGAMNKPNYCEICNKAHPQIEGHHDDYSKSLEVRWVCSPCHKSL